MEKRPEKVPDAAIYKMRCGVSGFEVREKKSPTTYTITTTI